MFFLYCAMIAAAVFAVSRIAMDRIKEQDRKAGLNINDREYSIFRVFRHLFSSPDKRMRAETALTYPDFLKKNKKTWGKSVLRAHLVGISICAAGGIWSLFEKNGTVVSGLFIASLLFMAAVMGNVLFNFLASLISIFLIHNWSGVLIAVATIWPYIMQIKAGKAYKKAKKEAS